MALIARSHRIRALEKPLRRTIAQIQRALALKLLSQRRVHARRSALRNALHVPAHVGILAPRRLLLLRHVNLQTCHDATWVERQAVEVLRGEASRDGVGEVDVGCFGLPVGDPGLVAGGFGEVEVVGPGWCYAVAEGGDGDDARAAVGSVGEEEGFEEVEEEEVREVVCAELRFEVVGCRSLGGWPLRCVYGIFC